MDVRLTERSGQVLVAVRTPDAQLAGALRQDLPALSSRLEQSGFRAETWHPGVPAADSRARVAEAHSTNSSTADSDPSRHGGQHHQDSPPRQPKNPVAKAPNSPRKDFAWLLSQIS